MSAECTDTCSSIGQMSGQDGVEAATNAEDAVRPPDAVERSWTALQRNWADVKGAPRADVASRADALYEALMSHAEERSPASAAIVAKALAKMMECTATADYASMRQALFDDMLNPGLNDTSLECSRALARLKDPGDEARQAILGQTHKLLAASRWFRKGRNKNAPQSLNDARAVAAGLLDTLGGKCYDLIVQREWRESIEAAASAVDTMLTLPASQHDAAGAQLVRALRKMRGAVDTLDFEQSIAARHRSLIDGLPAGLRTKLESLVGIDAARDGAAPDESSTHVRRLNAFFDTALRKYEPDERMREKLHIFYGKLCRGISRLASTGSGLTQARSTLADGPGTPFLESGYKRSPTLLRRLSRLRQWLRGSDKKAQLHTHNEIKDLVDGLVGNKNVHQNKLDQHRVMLNDLLTPAVDETQTRSQRRADALAYLDHTLRKLTPREMQTLETILTGSHELAPALGSSPDLHAALERSLTREIHIRDLMHHVDKIETALNLGRFGDARIKRRGRALIAAADDYHTAAARVPDDLSAFELTRLALQRRQELEPSGAGALKNKGLVASAFNDMNRVLGHKSEDGRRSRRHLLDVCAYAARVA
ncbi:hypothetical protein [Bordetella sp. N]|uniref:hypothetical protein n=1 Tax=Bordetella sp. N TaxID=1746199 RepID=UPI0012E383F0|nr:hypothetical protein [Bordetella sp. N]